MRQRYNEGEYIDLVWDQDGEPSAHYVAGHVTEEEFRVEIERWFSASKRKPVVPHDAKIEHVYISSVRVENDKWGNRCYEWRHCAPGRGRPVTYWEVWPNRATGV